MDIVNNKGSSKSSIQGSSKSNKSNHQGSSKSKKANGSNLNSVAEMSTDDSSSALLRKIPVGNHSDESSPAFRGRLLSSHAAKPAATLPTTTKKTQRVSLPSRPPPPPITAKFSDKLPARPARGNEINDNSGGNERHGNKPLPLYKNPFLAPRGYGKVSSDCLARYLKDPAGYLNFVANLILEKTGAYLI
jgi:hypothetical protein